MAMTPAELDNYIKSRIEVHVAGLIGSALGEVDEKITQLGKELADFVLTVGVQSMFKDQVEAMWKEFVELEYQRLHAPPVQPAPMKKVVNQPIVVD